MHYFFLRFFFFLSFFISLTISLIFLDAKGVRIALPSSTLTLLRDEALDGLRLLVDISIPFYI